MALLTIQNRTEVQQHAYMDTGHRHTLEPYEIREVPEEIAHAFLLQRAPSVQKYDVVILPPAAGERVVWLANMTGNPFAPDTVKVLKQDPKTGFEVAHEFPNQLKSPMPVTREMETSQEIVMGDSGKESISHPPITITLPPYKRHPFGATIAEWMLRRDAQMDELSVGKIAAVRAPSNFEPNDSWDFRDIVVFAHMVEDLDWIKLFNLKDETEAQAKKSKAVLLQALFFRLCDHRYALPTEPAFKLKLMDVTERSMKIDAEKKAQDAQRQQQHNKQQQGR